MKAQTKLGVAFGGLLAVSLFAGCTGLPGAITPPSGTPSITGKVNFNGGNPNQALALGVKKYDGANWTTVSGVTTNSDNTGKYSFSSIADGQYQVVYNDGGQVVTSAADNTDGVYVSDPVTTASGSTQTVNFDLYWPFSPTIKPNDTFSVPNGSTFGFAANPNASGAQYQVLVSDSNKASVWSSNWATTTSFQWNGNAGSETASPTGNKAASGSYFYLIKFRKAGGTYGGGNYYGQTKWVPFTLTNP